MKNSGLAAILSFFIVGLGQMYNGQIGKGVGLFCLAALNGLILTLPVVGALILVVAFPLWIWNIVDAYKTAERLNSAAATATPSVTEAKP